MGPPQLTLRIVWAESVTSFPVDYEDACSKHSSSRMRLAVGWLVVEESDAPQFTCDLKGRELGVTNEQKGH